LSGEENGDFHGACDGRVEVGRRFDDVRTVLEENGSLTLERDGEANVVFKPDEYVRYYPTKFE
jgi:hypothetical protein